MVKANPATIPQRVECVCNSRYTQMLKIPFLLIKHECVRKPSFPNVHFIFLSLSLSIAPFLSCLWRAFNQASIKSCNRSLFTRNSDTVWEGKGREGAEREGKRSFQKRRGKVSEHAACVCVWGGWHCRKRDFRCKIYHTIKRHQKFVHQKLFNS